MRHDIAEEAYGYRLRPITVSDAAFVVELRSDPKRTRYLHPISGEIGDQERWLKAYLDRTDDYYWVIERLRDGRREGTIGLYAIDGAGSAEAGRWIILPGSRSAAASGLLVVRIAFERLDLQRLLLHSAAENHQSVSFHDKMGHPRTAFLPAALDLDGRMHDVIEHTISRDRWPEIRAEFERRAQHAQHLLDRGR